MLICMVINNTSTVDVLWLYYISKSLDKTLGLIHSILAQPGEKYQRPPNFEYEREH